MACNMLFVDLPAHGNPTKPFQRRRPDETRRHFFTERGDTRSVACGWAFRRIVRGTGTKSAEVLLTVAPRCGDTGNSLGDHQRRERPFGCSRGMEA